ncbi:hypothetical protein [Corynebacterium aquatimens]|uniref:Uncharacterized protein n=1 Tax=Corynebacterium aquatimens TaxID=1190508 RepID=A0A931GR25_9CORY|nr:hypothetical protein [Corynebacterium aquatimens]MBG6121483.1 hypothetical protein [Corynebacterium aquatimens]WJY65973.1 hypothetical protein CAQUA_06340 [Corynebacterium aquatimens]
MASSIRSRRITLAAGALAVALVAPLSPALDLTALPAAVAQNTVDDPTKADFVGTFNTVYDFSAGTATVKGIELPDDVVVVPNYAERGIGVVKAEDRWGVKNVNGRVVLTEPQSLTGKGGTYSMPIRVKMPKNGIRAENLPKSNADAADYAEAFNVSDAEFKFNVDRRPQWVHEITGLDVRHEVDFSEEPRQTLDAVQIPLNAETYTETRGWTTFNDGGRLQILPPSTYGGGIQDIVVKLRVPDNEDPTKSWSETVTVRINGTKPKGSQSIGDVLGGLLGGGGEGGGAGAGAVGAILGLLGLGGAAAGGGAGLFPSLTSLINVNVTDPKVDIHGNSINDSGNPIVEVKDNNATATVDVRDNGRDNNAFVDVPVNVTDNVKGNVEGRASLLGGGGGNGGGDGAGLSSKKSNDSTPSTDNGTAANKSSNNANLKRLQSPECIASIVGLGVPLLVMIPTILGALRVPGFEGAQEAVRAAAHHFSLHENQVAAGVGGFGGALALAGLAGIITQCIPAADEVPQATVTTTVVPAPSN